MSTAEHDALTFSLMAELVIETAIPLVTRISPAVGKKLPSCKYNRRGRIERL